MNRLATLLLLVFALSAYAESIEPPRKEWRGRLKAHPARSEARKLAVSLDAAQAFTLAPYVVTRLPVASEASLLDIDLMPYTPAILPWDVTVASFIPEVLTLNIAIVPYTPEILPLDVALSPHQSEATPWSLAFAADFAATHAAIERTVRHDRYPAAIGTPAWMAAERGEPSDIELLERFEKLKKEEK